MHDLKAAAERLRVESQYSARAMEALARTGEQADQCKQESDDFVLAAQALEALAWQWETGASVRQMRSGGFFCAVTGDEIVNNYYADTPLGAILAAMDGEVPNDRG